MGMLKHREMKWHIQGHTDLFCVNTGLLGTTLTKVPSPEPESQFIMKWHKSPRLMESLAKDGDSGSHDSMLQKLALRAKELLAREDILLLCPGILSPT